MPLAVGARLGAFEIVGAIGAGGMGEVYRARDTKLGREVAIKILPRAFTSDPERLARFEREARVLASLNHPNIGTLYGVEDAEPSAGAAGMRALVMELVEGETLSERIAGSGLKARGSGLPLPEALAIARQIADALDAAHEKGIVHRDLKPANIKITPGGLVKVLDFGLAKLGAGAAGGAGEAGVDGPNRSQSPTATVAGTRDGVILGTAAYMSPEQARGKVVDKRTDIWAFGCVLHEMLTGQRAFARETVSDTIAAILERNPDWSRLPAETPPGVRRLLHRCIEKDPLRRQRDIADARVQLDEVDAATSASSPLAGGRSSRRHLVTVVAVLTIGAAGGWTIGSGLLRAGRSLVGDPPPEARLQIVTPPTTDPVSVAISPDGRRVVFVATSEGRSVLWLRALDAVDPRALAGTDDAAFPFWSPDSRSVAFFANGQLKRLDIEAGTVQVLAAAFGGRGGAWNQDGTILFTAGPGGSPMARIAATGGEPVAVAPQGRFPQFLPDGRHFIYFVPQAFTPESRGVWVGQLDKPDGRRLLDADAAAVYAASGHLLFVRQGTLLAQAFDTNALTLSGNPFPVAGGLGISEPPLVAGLSASAAGPIVYRTGSAGGLRQFAWFNRSGLRLADVGDPVSNLRSPSMAPDGTRVAVHRSLNGNTDIWLLDVRRGVFSRFTSNPAGEFYPVWSPDGRRILYNLNGDLYEKPAASAGAEERVQALPDSEIPTDWSHDGRFVLYFTAEPNPNTDIWALPMDQDRKPFPVAQSNFDERDGQFSPDGKWVAFQSNESGRFEIYVRPFPGAGGKLQISSNGGAMARWRPDGQELFYIGLDDRLMAVPIKVNSGAFEAGTPVPLFLTRVGGAQQANSLAQYIVSPDGQRFLMNTVADEVASPITVILNWKADSAGR